MNIQKLKGKMAENGISQLKLAELTGMNKNTLNSRFKGRTEFCLEEAEIICKALRISDPADIASIFFPGCLKSETEA